MDFARACSIFLVGGVLAVAVQVVFFSPICLSPQPLQLPSPSTTVGFTSNAVLQGVTKLGEGYLKQPEDVAVDKRNGIIYTATRDGWIKRMHRNGTWENWKWTDSHALLGLTITPAGDVVVCDAEKGLLKVSEEGFTVLASHVNGAQIRFADDVVGASDGSLYFSVASTKFQLHEFVLDMLEGKPHGQLLKYDPSSNQTIILLDNLGFANGVELSPNEDYLVVCETWKFRCLKYWLRGANQGKAEIFVDNLPGGPDNIKLAPDGSFWIALLDLQMIPRSLNFIHRSNAAKHVGALFPRILERFIGVFYKAMVAKVTPEGDIIKVLDDPTGKVMTMVTSALEFEDNLYLGNLASNFIGKISLKTTQA